MQKVQVFLRSDQRAALKSIATRTGQRQSELIRKGVDLLIDRAEREDVDWREVTREVAGVWKGRTDLEDFTREIREAAKRRVANLYNRD